MTTRARSAAVFGLALTALIAFKLWLVHGEEIVGSATQYDALWYVRSARDWYWGATYDWLAFIRPCAYPLWIASMRLLHIPLRLAIELLQIGGALTFVAALRTLGVNRWACLVSFACLCLHPIGFQLNDYTVSDTFYGALLWFTLGGLLFIWSRRRPWTAIASGGTIAILWNTREEVILLIALIAIWSGFLLLDNWRRSLRLIALTGATAALLIITVYAKNDLVFRSFARSEMTAPVFQSLYHSLLRIKPAEPKPYAPITMETLHRACAVSPTFAKLRAPLEGPIGQAWRIETDRQVGTPNEIGVGWIVWATRQTAAGEGIFASPKTARRFFTKAAQEINAACDDGRLPTRFVLDGFLDPFTQSGGLRRLPESAARVAARVFARWSIGPIADDSNLTTAEKLLYDEMTLRRAAGVGPRTGAAVFTEKLIGSYHFFFMFVLHLLAAGALVSLWHSRRCLKGHTGLVCAIALLAAAVFLRAALLAWLDATAFDATQDRFLAPILPLWSVLLVLVIALRGQIFSRPNEKGRWADAWRATSARRLNLGNDGALLSSLALLVAPH